MKTILITGAAGFIFSNFMNIIPKLYPLCEFIMLDNLVEPYTLYNINKNYKFYFGDITNKHFIDNLFKIEKIDIIIHGAARSFVDDSIKDASLFVNSNVLGTQILIDAAVKYDIENFIMISSDEVYGQLKIGEKSWTEENLTKPRNPYSASKLAAELLVQAAHETHGLQYKITRCCNNYGPRQPPRNLVPKVISSILKNEQIPIHGNGTQIREWLFTDDHCLAIMEVLYSDKLNQIFNIGSGVELTNLEMTNKICEVIGKGKELISFVKDRPGHDFRYSVNCDKIKTIGWHAKTSFNEGIKKCINWYIENQWYFK